MINGTPSDQFLLTFGLPKGSFLGQILFVIYTSKLFYIIKNRLPHVHTYADDTQVYISFKSKSTRDQSEQFAMQALEACKAEIRMWMLSDRLVLIDDKTEFLIIGTRYQLKKVNIDHVSVGISFFFLFLIVFAMIITFVLTVTYNIQY